MDTRRLQGWALVLSAICLLLQHFLPASSISHILAIIGAILFIVGIPAIQALQPEGILGFIGILLLELSALIVLAFLLNLAGSAWLALTSAILAMLGRVIIGWLTIRCDRFPAWAGWAFLIAGILNLVAGAADLGAASAVVSIIAVFLDAVALLGYGYPLLR